MPDGALHGLNPATGWLLAAAWGVRTRDRAQALRALLPIGVGHLASVALVANLGDDSFGRESLSHLQAQGLDTTNVQLDGKLTIKGVTAALHATGTVEGPTEDFMGNTRLGFTLKAMIDRTAYGVSWNADLPSGGRALSDDVELTAELEVIQAA